MSRRYNALNDLHTDWTKTGVCPVKECGRRLTDPACTHATPEQREFVASMDAEFYSKSKYNVIDEAAERVEIGEILQWLEPESNVELRQLVAHPFTPDKPTRHVSREWAMRHLNVDANGFEAELDKAFGKGNWTLGGL